METPRGDLELPAPSAGWFKTALQCGVDAADAAEACLEPFYVKEPSANADHLVVLLHGYNGMAHHLEGLARTISAAVPSCVVLLPKRTEAALSRILGIEEVNLSPSNHHPCCGVDVALAFLGHFKPPPRRSFSSPTVVVTSWCTHHKIVRHIWACTCMALLGYLDGLGPFELLFCLASCCPPNGQK